MESNIKIKLYGTINVFSCSGCLFLMNLGPRNTSNTYSTNIILIGTGVFMRNQSSTRSSKIYVVTRMHSSGMRNIRCSGRLGYNSICFVGARWRTTCVQHAYNGRRSADDIVINGFENHSIYLSHLIPLHGVRSKQDLCGILLNIDSFPRTFNFAFVSVHF